MFLPQLFCTFFLRTTFESVPYISIFRTIIILLCLFYYLNRIFNNLSAKYSLTTIIITLQPVNTACLIEILCNTMAFHANADYNISMTLRIISICQFPQIPPTMNHIHKGKDLPDQLCRRDPFLMLPNSRSSPSSLRCSFPYRQPQILQFSG